MALVTGAAGGLGTAIATGLAYRGYRVAAADLELPRGAADQWALDVTEEAAWEFVVSGVVRTLGRLDALVNAAGINEKSPLLEFSVESFRRVTEVNQIGCVLGMRTAGRVMVEQGCGSIVNLGSIMGMTGGYGSLAYTASKFAIRGMTKVAALELGRHGVRVNAVVPGIIDAGMGSRTVAEHADEAARDVPLGRLGAAHDVTDAVAFLCGPESNYITGAELVVDGGWLAGRRASWAQVARGEADDD